MIVNCFSCNKPVESDEYCNWYCDCYDEQITFRKGSIGNEANDYFLDCYHAQDYEDYLKQMGKIKKDWV